MYQVADERSLRALAHPLRLRLLAHLRADGPATATRLAERVGESSGVTSYHLRKLAEAGLIEEATELGNRRERWWRSAHEATSWRPSDFLGHQDAVDLRHHLLRWQQAAVEQYLAEEQTWAPAWVDACGSSDALLRLRPEQARDLHDALLEVLRRFADAGEPGDDPESERVLVFVNIIPVRELPW